MKNARAKGARSAAGAAIAVALAWIALAACGTGTDADGRPGARGRSAERGCACDSGGPCRTPEGDCDCAAEGACSASCRCHVPVGGFVRVRGGSFRMGLCPSGERPWCGSPSRTVAVGGFYMAAREVTQGEWFDVMGTRPSRFAGELDFFGHPVRAADWRNLPVERVSWLEAAAFANAASERAGLEPAYVVDGANVEWNRAANGYRLPTEAEWEFAARGGIVCQGGFVFPGSDSAAEAAWHDANAGDRTREVGLLRPNALGLFDMGGNVSEWVWDWHGVFPSADGTDPTGPAHGVFRSARGGGWFDLETNVRSAARARAEPASRGSNVGLRLARS